MRYGPRRPTSPGSIGGPKVGAIEGNDAGAATVSSSSLRTDWALVTLRVALEGSGMGDSPPGVLEEVPDHSHRSVAVCQVTTRPRRPDASGMRAGLALGRTLPAADRGRRG